jgi:cobalt-precorrin 5A hydrolase
MTQRLAIGFGSSSRASCRDVLSLIQSQVRVVRSEMVLATLDRRATIGESVARSLGVPLILFPASILSEIPGVESCSTRASEAVGSSSVAEASALASLGPSARLLVPRRTGRFCTCAVAVLP